MGLDITFDLHPALEAGAKLEITTVKYPPEEYSRTEDPEYHIQHWFKVPDYDYWSSASYYLNPSMTSCQVSVRANKWGVCMNPLKNSLKRMALSGQKDR